MQTDTLKAIQAYLQLSAQQRARFLSEIKKIETMHAAVKSEYEKTLLSSPAGN